MMTTFQQKTFLDELLEFNNYLFEKVKAFFYKYHYVLGYF